jgi:AcrR family transcriptional regulator
MSARSEVRRTGSAREGGQVSEMQRRRLLLAVVEVASQGGLEAATVGRVCEQASVSRRTFYELFEDREACLLAAFDAHVESIGGHMRLAFEGPGRWNERIGRALTLLLEHLDTEPDVARFCVIETPRAGGQLVERRRRVLERLANAVEEGATEARAGNRPPLLTAQGVVGGALSVIHARLLDTASGHPVSLLELGGQLMAMIVHPYLGVGAARDELERCVPTMSPQAPRPAADPFKGLPIRVTYRTARVLSTIADHPGASNRHVADSSGIVDDGQVSRLLTRLSRCELIENHGEGHSKGEPNAWSLTERGEAINAAITLTSARS